MITILFVTFLLLLLFGVPIAFAMTGSALLALLVDGNLPLTLLVQRIYAPTDSFSIMAIPFFIIAGEIMTTSRMTDSLVGLCDALLGHLRSGLGTVTIVACTIFAGISGSGAADVAAIGSVMIPQLEKRGYPKGVAAALVAAAGGIGPIIPPSLLMIIYAALSEQSVGQMFLGGIVPGLIIGAGLFTAMYLWNLKTGWEPGSGQPPSYERVVPELRKSLIPLGTPLVIIGGIAGGVFTATEAGVAAAVYALVAAVLIGKMSIQDLKSTLLRSGMLSAPPLFVIAAASIFAWILVSEGFPAVVSDFVINVSGGNALLGAVLVVAMLLALGFFIEVIALMIIFVPILTPLGLAMGFDPIHWGLVLVMAMSIGGITPPVGANLYIAASIADCSLGAISRYITPFVVVHVAVTFLVLFVPDLVLWIPRLLF